MYTVPASVDPSLSSFIFTAVFMALRKGHAAIIQVPRKLEKRFYEVLVVLAALDPTRGEQIPQHFIEEYKSDEEIRRDFLDSVSYACDYEKGGTTVTAALLQHTYKHNILWLAVNSSCSPETVEYIKQLLPKSLVL